MLDKNEIEAIDRISRNFGDPDFIKSNVNFYISSSETSYNNGSLIGTYSDLLKLLNSLEKDIDDMAGNYGGCMGGLFVAIKKFDFVLYGCERYGINSFAIGICFGSRLPVMSNLANRSNQYKEYLNELFFYELPPMYKNSVEEQALKNDFKFSQNDKQSVTVNFRQLTRFNHFNVQDESKSRLNDNAIEKDVREFQQQNQLNVNNLIQVVVRLELERDVEEFQRQRDQKAKGSSRVIELDSEDDAPKIEEMLDEPQSIPEGVPEVLSKARIGNPVVNPSLETEFLEPPTKTIMDHSLRPLRRGFFPTGQQSQRLLGNQEQPVPSIPTRTSLPVPSRGNIHFQPVSLPSSRNSSDEQHATVPHSVSSGVAKLLSGPRSNL